MIHTPTVRDSDREYRSFRFRLLVALLLTLLGAGTLCGRWLWLQVIQHEHYETMAEANRIALAPIAPNRGLISDRNGILLASNYSAYTLEITPNKIDDLDQTLTELGTIIELTPRDLKRFKKLREESQSFASLPLRSRLNEAEVARFAVQRYRFPGVEIKARLFRNYPLGSSASHLIGYIGRINDADVKRLEANDEFANYRGSDHIGKLGIEQHYEHELHGTTGFEQVETDAGGRSIRSLKRREPIAGNNLVLTLDSRIQTAAENAFGDHRGALVAIDPRNGEIIAFVSQPGYDPNLFVDGIDQQNWDALNQNPDHPLTNRALKGQYPPGSTIKPFMALAGLSLGKRTATSTISDPGFYALPGSSHHYRDWRPNGHGAVDLKRSIMQSCDTYYYGLAVDMGIESMARFLSQFGFGQATGVDLDGESVGVLPSPAWKRKHYHQEWFLGETVIAGIGQGYHLVTPLQLAHATAVLANGGRDFTPHLVKSIRSPDGTPLSVAAPMSHTLDLNPQALDLVRDAMIGVMGPGGTGAKAGAGLTYTMAGKTGTAQVVGVKQNEKYNAARLQEAHRDHALFIGFAPAESPTLAIAVLVENAGHGGDSAAPIARQVMDSYLLGTTTPGAPAPEDSSDDSEDD